MFKERVPAYLTGFATKQNRKSEEKEQLIVLSFMVQPFRRDLAEQIAPAVARRFFNADGTRPDDVDGFRFKAKHPQQRLVWYAAPDDVPEAITIRNADVATRWSVRADTETPDYSASFSVTFSHPTGQDMLTILNTQGNTVWLEFAAEQEGLLKDGDDEKPPQHVKRGRRAKDEPTLPTGDAEPVAAH